MSPTSWPAASVAAREETSEGIAVLTYDDLDVQQIIASVGDNGAGATAVFIGTTRDSFKGKVVTRLDYQAYSKLAMKTMMSIIHAAHERRSQSTHHTENKPVSAIIRVAVHHRLGTVPVGQPSIVIAVSSPHRRESFEACEFVLEEVKQKAQIWKREFYEGESDETAEWKANSAS